MKPEEKPICEICGGSEIITEHDVGWDIDEGGEERQHIDRCKCGAWRFNIDYQPHIGINEKIYGKWQKEE
jgi:hypothetical protein